MADENTWRAAGQEAADRLRQAGLTVTDPLILSGRPVLHASLDNARKVLRELQEQDSRHGCEVVPLAIGSGTLNDLTKMAAKDAARPYGVIGTAASMDGYTGAGAPISDHGVKVTMNCVAPKVVIVDLDVAAAAPSTMVASGYGDLSAKIPGGADWILADAAGVEAVDPHVWELVQSGVNEALSSPNELAAGNPDAFSGLVSGLMLSGLAMQVYGGTRPASGAEHYFSHIWELAGLGEHDNPPLSHGKKVAIGTLAMLAFYEKFMARNVAALDIDAAVSQWPQWDEVERSIRATFEGALADHAVKETKVKYVDQEGLAQRLGRIVEAWPQTADQLQRQLRPARQFADQLRRAGAPSRPEDIGLTPQDVRDTFPKAMYYRSRYTVLDVAREAGWFDQIVDEVFAPGGLWT